MDQQIAINEIANSLNSKTGEKFLLYEKSGSGKTEVYIKIAEEALKRDQGTILLAPEIGLIAPLLKVFKEAFGNTVAVIHSGLTDKERNNEWEKISQGSAQIVIGTRIAIFAPVKNLKVVILDEEFETTYKSEQSPRYDTRSVAEYMADNFGVTAVFGSGTPSIGSFYKAKTGKYKLLTLAGGDQRLPDIKIVDMRKEKKKLLSDALRKEIKETLSRGEKIILFINRRGFFTFAVCRECGNTIKCPKCSVPFVYHFKEKKLTCNHCGQKAVANTICPNCNNSSIAFLGIGTQRIEEEVAEVYPSAKTVRIDKDSTIKRGSHEVLFSAFTEGNANVLIGTQMVTKGLDIAGVALVGIISADLMLNIPDFRSAENAFFQITQVAKRTGKHDNGKVIIQTLNPGHYAIKYAASRDYEGFYYEEIKTREELFYPPFSKLINIIIHGRDEQKAIKIANDLKKFLKPRIHSILGPVAAPISKIRGEYRYQILLKGKELASMREAIKDSLSNLVVPQDIRITVDVEPASLL